MDQKIFEDIHCCVCGNHDSSLISVKYKKDTFIVVECLNCSFLFIPQHFSKKISYEDYKGEEVLEQVKQGNNWLKMQRHLLRFKFIRRYKSSGDLFDLGTGWGHFLAAGRELGYKVHGIEVSEMPCKYAREELKLPVENLNFFKMEPKKNSCDLITMWDALEHIPEADEVIGRCNLMLKDGGYVILQVPEIDSTIAKLMKENWNMISAGHVNLFSKKTIKKLFEDRGFKVERIKSSFEFKLFLMYVLGKKKKSEAAKQEYFNKTAEKPAWMLKTMVIVHNLVYNLMSLLNIGDEMMVAAKKIKSIE
ncbi:MAG TPA: class I SAM-dependent methyltransferase [Ignavibacteriaceae bacterium]|nr:class I SAM-dependent methyltransferase [Ignavibacteriaceae bacterium]